MRIQNPVLCYLSSNDNHPLSKEEMRQHIEKNFIYCPLLKQLIPISCVWGMCLEKIDYLVTPLKAGSIPWHNSIQKTLALLAKTSPSSPHLLTLEELASDWSPKKQKKATQDIETSTLITDPLFIKPRSLIEKIGTLTKLSLKDLLFVLQNPLKTRSIPLFCHFCDLLKENTSPNILFYIDPSQSLASLPWQLTSFSDIQESLTTEIKKIMDLRLPFETIIKQGPSHKTQLKEQSFLNLQTIQKLKSNESTWISISPKTSHQSGYHLVSFFYRNDISKKIALDEKKIPLLRQYILKKLYDDIKKYAFFLDNLKQTPQDLKPWLEIILNKGIDAHFFHKTSSLFNDILLYWVPSILRKSLLHTVHSLFPFLEKKDLENFSKTLLKTGLNSACEHVLTPIIENTANHILEEIYIESLNSLNSLTPELKSLIDTFDLGHTLTQKWCCITKQENHLYEISVYSERTPKSFYQFKNIPEDFFNEELIFNLFRLEAYSYWDHTISFSEKDFYDIFLEPLEQFENPPPIQQEIYDKTDAVFFHLIRNNHKLIQQLNSLYQSFQITSLVSFLNEQILIPIESKSIFIDFIKNTKSTLIKELENKKITQDHFETIWSTLHEAQNIIESKTPENNSSQKSSWPHFQHYALDTTLNILGIDENELFIVEKALYAIFGDECKPLVQEILQESLICFRQRPKQTSYQFKTDNISFEEILNLLSIKIKENLPYLFWNCAYLTLRALNRMPLDITHVAYAQMEYLLFKHGPQLVISLLPENIQITWKALYHHFCEIFLSVIIKNVVHFFIDKQTLNSHWKSIAQHIHYFLYGTTTFDAQVLKTPLEIVKESIIGKMTSSDKKSVSLRIGNEVLTPFPNHDKRLLDRLHFYRLPEEHPQTPSWNPLTISQDLHSVFTQDFEKLSLLPQCPKRHLSIDNFWSQVPNKTECLQSLLKIVRDFKNSIYSVDYPQYTLHVIIGHYLLCIADYLTFHELEQQNSDARFIPKDFILFIQNPLTIVLDPQLLSLIDFICHYFDIDRSKPLSDKALQDLKKDSLFSYFETNYLYDHPSLDLALFSESKEWKLYENLLKREDVDSFFRHYLSTKYKIHISPKYSLTSQIPKNLLIKIFVGNPHPKIPSQGGSKYLCVPESFDCFRSICFSLLSITQRRTISESFSTIFPSWKLLYGDILPHFLFHNPYILEEAQSSKNLLLMQRSFMNLSHAKFSEFLQEEFLLFASFSKSDACSEEAFLNLKTSIPFSIPEKQSLSSIHTPHEILRVLEFFEQNPKELLNEKQQRYFIISVSRSDSLKATSEKYPHFFPAFQKFFTSMWIFGMEEKNLDFLMFIFQQNLVLSHFHQPLTPYLRITTLIEQIKTLPIEFSNILPHLLIEQGLYAISIWNEQRSLSEKKQLFYDIINGYLAQRTTFFNKEIETKFAAFSDRIRDYFQQNPIEEDSVLKTFVSEFLFPIDQITPLSKTGTFPDYAFDYCTSLPSFVLSGMSSITSPFSRKNLIHLKTFIHNNFFQEIELETFLETSFIDWTTLRLSYPQSNIFIQISSTNNFSSINTTFNTRVQAFKNLDSSLPIPILTHSQQTNILLDLSHHLHSAPIHKTYRIGIQSQSDQRIMIFFDDSWNPITSFPLESHEDNLMTLSVETFNDHSVKTRLKGPYLPTLPLSLVTLERLSSFDSMQLNFSKETLLILEDINLSFILKEDHNTGQLKAYLEKYPDYFIAQQQTLSSLPEDNILFLENSAGRKKAIVKQTSGFFLLEHLLSKKMTSFFGHLAQNYQKNILKIIPKSTLTKLDTKHHIFIIDISHSHQLESQEEVSIAFLIFFYLKEGRSDLVIENFEKLQQLALSQPLDSSTLRWILFSALSFFSSEKPEILKPLILKLFSLYQHNALFFNKKDPLENLSKQEKYLFSQTYLLLLYYLDYHEDSISMSDLQLHSFYKILQSLVDHFLINELNDKFSSYSHIDFNSIYYLVQLGTYALMPQKRLKEFVELSKKYHTSSYTSLNILEKALFLLKSQTKSPWEEHLDTILGALNLKVQRLPSYLLSILRKKNKTNFDLILFVLKRIKKVYEIESSFTPQYFNSYIKLCRRLDDCEPQDQILHQSTLLFSLNGSLLYDNTTYPPLNIIDFDPNILKERFFDYWRIAHDTPPVEKKLDEEEALQFSIFFKSKRKELQTLLHQLFGSYDNETNLLLDLLRIAYTSPLSFSNIDNDIVAPFCYSQKIVNDKTMSFLTPQTFLESINPFFRKPKLDRLKPILETPLGIQAQQLIFKWLHKTKSQYVTSLLLDQSVISHIAKELIIKGTEKILEKTTETILATLSQNILLSSQLVSKVSCGLTKFKIPLKIAPSLKLLSQTKPFPLSLGKMVPLPPSLQQELQELQISFDNITQSFYEDNFHRRFLIRDEAEPFPELPSSDATHYKDKLSEIQESLSDYHARAPQDTSFHTLLNKQSLLNLYKQTYNALNSISYDLQDDLSFIETWIHKKRLLSSSLIEQAKMSLQPKFQIDFKELLKSFLSTSSQKYQRLGIQYEDDISFLEQKIYVYLIKATFYQKLERILRNVKNLQTDLPSLSLKEIEKKTQQLASLIQQKRIYDFLTCEEKFLRANLIFEYKTALLLRPTQHQQMTGLVTSQKTSLHPGMSHCIEGIMGTGKTFFMMLEDAYLSADGDTICITNYPQTVDKVNTKDASKRAASIYNQLTYTKEIEPTEFRSLPTIEMFYQILQDCLKERNTISLTQQKAQSLELSFISLLWDMSQQGSSTSPPSSEDKNIATLFAKSLLLMRKKVLFISDEIHALSCPKKEKNLPLGNKKFLSNDTIDCVHFIMQTCLTHPQLQQELQIENNLQASLSSQTLQDVIIPSLAHSVVQKYYAGTSSDEKEELLLYLTGKLRSIPSFISRAHYTEKDKWGLFKGILTVILPSCLRSISHVESGTLKTSKKAQEFAIVYQGNCNPLENTIILNPIEALIKTYMSYASQNISQNQLKRVLTLIAKKASIEANSKKIPLQSTLSWKYCHSKWGIDIDTSPKILSDIAKNKTLQQNIYAKLLFVKHFPAKQIFYFETGAKMNAMNFFSMSKHHHGYSGSLYNKGCYYPQTKFILDKGTTGESLDLLLKLPQNRVQVIPQNLPQDILHACCEQWLCQTSFFALIDTGALFRGIDNKTIATILASKISSRKEIKGIGFYNDSNTPTCLMTDSLKCVPLDECSLLEHERFFYFDQSHIASADIEQPFKAQALLTIGEKTRFESEVLQGKWRMRGLKTKEQSIWFAIPEHITTLIGSPQPSIMDIIKFSLENEQKELAEKNFKADCNKILDVFRREVLDYILNECDLQNYSRALDAFNYFIELFIYKQSSSFFELYGQIDNWDTDPRCILAGIIHYWSEKISNYEALSDESRQNIGLKLKEIGHRTHYPSKIHTYQHSSKTSFMSPLLNETQDVSQNEDQNQDQDQNQDISLDQENSHEISQIRFTPDPTYLEAPIPWKESATAQDLVKSCETPLSSISYSFFKGYYTTLTPVLSRPVFLLKEVLEHSDFKVIAKGIDQRILVCNTMVQCVNGKKQKIFGSKQRPWKYIVIAENKIPSKKHPYTFLITDSTGMDFWYEKTKTNKEPLAIYDVHIDEFLISELRNHTHLNTHSSFAQLKTLCSFFSGKTDYSPDLHTHLKAWVKKCHIGELRDKFLEIKAIHNQEGAPFYGSSLETLLIEAEEELILDTISSSIEKLKSVDLF